jgi:hypothetical protein
MEIKTSLQEFKDYLRKSEKGTNEINAEDAIRIMCSFYEDIRCNEVSFETDGDMLLFQWGTYDWGNGEHFEIGFVRQFSIPEPKDEDVEFDGEGIWQLNMVLHYPPEESLKGIKPGQIWCHSPDEIEPFVGSILQHSATLAVKSTKPETVEMGFELV